MSKVILVIDDDPTIRELVKLLLDDTDCEAYSLSTPTHLTETVDRVRPRAALIDIVIRNPATGASSVADGWHAAQVIHDHAPEIPLVMFTASRQALTEFGVTERGSLFAAVLAKPFDVDQLNAVLDGICEAIS